MSTLLAQPRTPEVVSASVNERRVLFVSYHFPPVGGAGVQRPVKFVKYLRELGWHSSVLMAANPSAPVFDDSLCADLPHDMLRITARTLEPGYSLKAQLAGNSPANLGRKKAAWKRLAGSAVRSAAGLVLQPDAQILWLPAALRTGKRLLRHVPHDAIVATAPPYTNLLLGTLLKRRFGIPLILDYRDEWDLSNKYLENVRHDWLSQRIQGSMQRWVLRHADAVIGTTQASAGALAQRTRDSRGSASAHCIYNGFDDSDFPNVSTSSEGVTPRSGRVRLVYTGTLWNLTSVLPLVEAVERLHRDTPQVLSQLEFVFVGRKTSAQSELLARLSRTGCALEDRSYCDHGTAIGWMRSADAVCLLLSDSPGAERVVPAKLFEYLAINRPILAIAPEGETAQIIRGFFPDSHRVPADVEGIARWLSDRCTSRTQVSHTRTPGIDVFSRRHQAGQLADVLEQVLSRAGAAQPRSRGSR